MKCVALTTAFPPAPSPPMAPRPRPRSPTSTRSSPGRERGSWRRGPFGRLARWPRLSRRRPRCDEQLAAFILRHPRLLVLTGAGCSVASGIPEYRDHEGAWKSRPPVRYADFVASAAARRRYWARSVFGWARVAEAQPGAVHHALARLERGGYTRAVVTQNVDAPPPARGEPPRHRPPRAARRGRVPRVRRTRAAGRRAAAPARLERPVPRLPRRRPWAPLPCARPDGDAQVTRTSEASASPIVRRAAGCSSRRSSSSARTCRTAASRRPWPRWRPRTPCSWSGRR